MSQATVPPRKPIKNIDKIAIDVELHKAGWRLAHLPIRLANAGLGAVFHRQVLAKTAKVFGEVGGAGVAVGRVECETPGREGVKAPRDLRTAGAKRGGAAAAGDQEIENFEQRSCRAAARETGGLRRAARKRSARVRRCRSAHRRRRPTSYRSGLNASRCSGDM